MKLTVLTVPDCPNGPLLDQRLAEVLADRPGVPVTRHVITDERTAAEAGMHGSPTLLIDGTDPFAGQATPGEHVLPPLPRHRWTRLRRALDGRSAAGPRLRRDADGAAGGPARPRRDLFLPPHASSAVRPRTGSRRSRWAPCSSGPAAQTQPARRLTRSRKVGQSQDPADGDALGRRHRATRFAPSYRNVPSAMLLHATAIPTRSTARLRTMTDSATLAAISPRE